MQGTNIRHLAQWTAQLRKQVKALLEELGAASKSAGSGSAKIREQRLAELGRQVCAWRAAVAPLIGAMRAARGRRRARTSARRAGVLKDLSRRVRQVRDEAREALARFDAGLRNASTEARSMRSGQIASIESLVESLRSQLRQFMADVRDRRGRRSAAARGQRAGFVQQLKRGAPGAEGDRKSSAGPINRPAAKKPGLTRNQRSLAHNQRSFVQNILGMTRPRKIA
jgi:hypothetical protein